MTGPASKGTMTLDELQASDIDTVIVAAPDMSGRLLGKRMSLRKFGNFIEAGVPMSNCVFGWDLPQDIGLEVPFAGFHNGWHDFMLVPDLDTIRRAAWLDRTAIVMADIVDEHTRELIEIAPRTILRRQIERLAEQGYSANVGTELEFHMYRETYDDLRQRGFHNRTPSTLIHSDYTVQQVNAWEPFFQDVRRKLDESGMDVDLSQGEWGLGQWEINLTYGDALDMCDRHVIYKLALKDMATRAGYSVTFMPKPNAGLVGSSCHVHLSLDADGSNPMWDEADSHHISDVMRHGIGGILANAGDLMAWYAPTINSYRRTNSDDFAGSGATWGFDNRTVSCRVLGTSPSSLRLEWRVPGADVNPYLVVAGLIASVGTGVDTKTDPGAPASGDAYQERVRAFPAHLGEAAERFISSDTMRQMFGEEVVEQYGLTARWEWTAFMNAVTDWEHDRYYESI